MTKITSRPRAPGAATPLLRDPLHDTEEAVPRVANRVTMMGAGDHYDPAASHGSRNTVP